MIVSIHVASRLWLVVGDVDKRHMRRCLPTFRDEHLENLFAAKFNTSKGQLSVSSQKPYLIEFHKAIS